MSESGQDAAVASLGLPPIDQIGFVVKSVDAAAERYAAMFGPWTRMNGAVEAAHYRGRIADVKLELLFGHAGELEIEFIEWQSGESPHREFIEQGREGMHHLRYRVDDAVHWVEKVATVGYEPIWSKQFTEEIFFTYLERKDDPLLIEFLQMA